MSDDKTQNRFQSTYPARISYPHLFEAVYMDLPGGRKSDKKTFSCIFLIEPDGADFAAMLRIVLRISGEKLGGQKYTVEQLARATGAQLWGALERQRQALDFPFKDGTAIAEAAKARGKDAEISRGKIVFKTSSGAEYAPNLGGLVNGDLIDFKTADQKAMFKGMFDAGKMAYYEVNFRDYRVGNNKPGVNAYLSLVFATGEGEAIVGRGSPSETFRGVIGRVNPTVNPMDGTTL